MTNEEHLADVRKDVITVTEIEHRHVCLHLAVQLIGPSLHGTGLPDKLLPLIAAKACMDVADVFNTYIYGPAPADKPKDEGTP